MAFILANIVTVAAALIAVVAILVRYLIPIYPVEGVDPVRLLFNLAAAQYGGLILALFGAGFAWWKNPSAVRKIRILILTLAVGTLAGVSAIRGNAETRPTVVAPHAIYRFTTDWVSVNESIWSGILSEFKGKPDVHVLEVGSFEGRSALWFLENILTHPTSSMTCVDIWSGDFEKIFDANIRTYGHPQKVVKIKGSSEEVLRGLQIGRFDFIYIDGSHIAKNVLVDAILGWGLLKPGDIIIFDDYNWGGFKSWVVPHSTPKRAVNAFLDVFGPYVEVMHQDYQLALRKKERVDIESFGTVRRLVINILRLLG